MGTRRKTNYKCHPKKTSSKAQGKNFLHLIQKEIKQIKCRNFSHYDTVTERF